MNPYLLFIIAAIILRYGLGRISAYLNQRALDPRLPEEMAGFYDADKYARSQEYTRVNTAFSHITSTFDTVVLLGFIFLGGFPFLDHFVRTFNFGPVSTGICFIFILAFASGIISLPFEIYDTFVIEERFGFNKTTPRTFITDRIKAVMLSVLIGAPILFLILYIFEVLGSYAWLAAWLAVTLYSFIVAYIAPAWIMPLFNKFTPLPTGELRDLIES